MGENMVRSREKIIIGLGIGLSLTYFGNRVFSAKRLKVLPADMIGLWQSECMPASSLHPKPHKGYISFTINGDYEASYTSYQDLSCQKAEVLTVFTGPISVYEPDRNGEQEISWGIKTIEYQMLSSRAVELANKETMFEMQDWKILDPKKLTVTKRTYDIMKMQGGQIFFGDSATGNMASPKTRPKMLETRSYTKVGTQEAPKSMDLAVESGSQCVRRSYQLLQKMNAIRSRINVRTATKIQKKGYDQIMNGFRPSIQTYSRCLERECKQNDSLACKMKQHF